MRYFVNRLQDFVPGTRVQIDGNHWKQIVLGITKNIMDNMPPTFDNCDGGAYVGCAGVAYMFQRLAESALFAAEKDDFLTKARNYSDVALSYASSKHNRDPPAAFLLGPGGVYAIGSLVYNDLGQLPASIELNKKYQALGAVCQPVNYLKCGSDELLVGRAGYLCGALLLNRKFGQVCG